MSQETQESFEDYLELDQFIEQLHLQKSARLPANLAPQQTHIYGMAALLHTATPSVADPRPEFKTQLYERLLKQARAEEPVPRTRTAGPTPIPAPVTPFQGRQQLSNTYLNNEMTQPMSLPSARPESTDVKKRKARGLSRRTLFTGGTIAASLIASAGVGAGVGASMGKPSQPQPDSHPTLTESTPGTWQWHPVASVDKLGKEVVPFTTSVVSGYVTRQTEKTGDEQIIAFSSACPHLGCPVQLQENTGHFACPCHARIFDTTGGPIVIENSLPHHTALSRLDTKVENGKIYVKVPPSPSV